MITPTATRSSRSGALLALVATMILWGAHGATAKTLVDALPWPQVVALNNGLAALFLLVFCAVTGRLNLLRRYSARQYAQLAFSGAIGVFAYYALLLYSFSTHPKVLQFQVLNYLFPVMTVLFSAALVRGERLTWRRLASVGLAFLGAFWVLSKGRPQDLAFTEWRGDLAAFGAGAAYGLFTALGKRFRYETFSGMLIFFLVGAALSTTLLLTLIAGGRVVPVMPRWNAWLGLAFVGIGSNCLGAVTWFRAVRSGDLGLIGSLVNLTLFASIGFFYLLCSEAPGASTFLGSLFVVAGAALASRTSKSPEHDALQP
jgi:drug/metabolite transporter (DMT)-like permease